MDFSEFLRQKPGAGGHKVQAAMGTPQGMGYSKVPTESAVPEELQRGQETGLLCEL